MISTLVTKWNRFWFESDVLRVRLDTFRAVFFGLLAFDQWMLMVVHAPRYGVGGFNVSHLPSLDPILPVPTAGLMTLAFFVGGFLPLRVALGIATRGSLYALTVIYGAAYFWSQADSYQHHYLIALLLLLCCFLPHEVLTGLERPADGAPRPPRVRSWATRLIYVEVSIVYFYTAVTKTTEEWMNGWALERIIQTESMRGFLGWSAEVLSLDPLTPYAVTGHVIMLWQYFVALAFLVPRLHKVACITGPLFHILVEVIDLKIGWFSYYMIGIYYILLFPDAWFMAVGRPIARLLQPLKDAWGWLVKPRPLPVGMSALWAVGAGLVAGLVAASVPVAGADALGAIIGLIVAAAVWPRVRPCAGAGPRARALVQVLGVVALWGSVHVGETLYDYHRRWAGQLARHGDLVAAAAHYEQANDVAPEGPARYFQLAEIYVRLGRFDDAERAFVAGLERAPDSARGRDGLERLRTRPGR